MSWLSLETLSSTLNQISTQANEIVAKIEEKATEFIYEEEIPQKPTKIYWEDEFLPEIWKDKPNELKQEIFRISTNQKNFKIQPKENFYFLFEENINQAQLMIKEDKKIKQHLLELVPTM